jgi:hypothetical protein
VRVLRPSDLPDQGKEALLAKVNSLGLKDIRLDTVHMLLCVMHESREINQRRFLNEIFPPWHELRRKTKPHFGEGKRLGRETDRDLVPDPRGGGGAGRR